MTEFKILLEETLISNELEELVPSQEYSEREKIYMEGYNQALKDIYEDFNFYYEKFMKDYHSFSLN
jgi:hypothetical protein